MAWSFTSFLGSANNKASGTTLAISPNATVPVGAVLVAVCASDNIAVGGGQTKNHVVADFQGNVWQKIREQSNTAASAAGITGSVWATQITSQLLTSDSIVLGISGAVTAKAIGLYQYAVGSNKVIAFRGASSNEQDATDSPTISLGGGVESLPYALFGVVFREDDTAGTYTVAANYNDRTKFGTTGSTGTTNVSCIVGDRVATLSSDTFAPTSLSSAADVVSILIAMQELGTVDPKSCTIIDDGDSIRIYSGLFGYPLGDIENARRLLADEMSTVDRPHLIRAAAKRLQANGLDPATATLGQMKTAIESSLVNV